MEPPKGVRLVACLGATDRGTLWRAVREPQQDRIIRFVDQPGRRFKHLLTVLRQRERPRLVPIVGHGIAGPHYYVEYQVGTDCQTLEERMAVLPHWRDRLLMLRQVCEVVIQWRESPMHPLGLNARDIIMMRRGGRWSPWLLPCPPVAVPSPSDLLDLDRHILATVAPEVIRGVQVDHQGQDAYALGTLAAQAAGCVTGEPAADDAVTDQARNVLLRPSPRSSEIPAFLSSAAPVRDFFTTVARYRHADPNVRPREATDLSRAVLAVTDVLGLAEAQQWSDPRQVVEILRWLRPDEGEPYCQGLLRAAAISAENGEPDEARELIGQVVALVPGYLPARRQRADLLWQLVSVTGELGRDDPIGLELLADLDVLKRGSPTDTDPYRRAAALHLRWGEAAQAAQELYAVVESDWADLAALELYGECWKALENQANTAAVAQEGHHRVDRLKAVGMLTETEGRRWHDGFDALLH